MNECLMTPQLKHTSAIGCQTDGNTVSDDELVIQICFKTRKEGNVLFNNACNTFLFTVIWCHMYGKGPLI